MFNQKPAGSLFSGFGQNQQQNQQQPSTSLFGQPSTGTSLFGNTNTNTTSTQPSTNLFGSTPTQNNQQQQQQQQQGTNIFGQPAAGSTSLFGSTTQPTQQNAPTSSLFGSTTTTQPQQTSLFGTSANVPTTSLFGNSTMNQQQPQSNQPSGSLFGAPAQNQQMQQPTMMNSNAPLFTRNTKFNDLPEEIKKKFEQMDSHIQGRVQISTDLKQRKLGDEPLKGSDEIRVVHKDLVININHLRTDIIAMQELRSRMDQAVQDTIAATRLIDSFKAPAQPTQQGQLNQSQNAAWLKTYANFPLEFFTRVTTQLQERMQWVNNTLEQIERKLISEANHTSVTPHSITSTLQAQHTSFVALASKAAALDAELQKLKNTYRTLWRAQTGSARDPFDERDRGALGNGEFGLEGLSIGVA